MRFEYVIVKLKTKTPSVTSGILLGISGNYLTLIPVLNIEDGYSWITLRKIHRDLVDKMISCPLPETMRTEVDLLLSKYASEIRKKVLEESCI